MMTNQEMKNEVLRRAKALEESRRRRQKIGSSGLLAALVLALTVMIARENGSSSIVTAPPESSQKADMSATGQWETHRSDRSGIPPVTSSSLTNDTEKGATAPQQSGTAVKTQKGQTPDSFGEDELTRTTIVLEGSRSYRFLPASRYALYGVAASPGKADCGAYLGHVQKVDSNAAKDIPVASKDSALIGCPVFLYRPMDDDAALLVNVNGRFQLFLFDEFVNETRYRE